MGNELHLCNSGASVVPETELIVIIKGDKVNCLLNHKDPVVGREVMNNRGIQILRLLAIMRGCWS